MIALENVYLTLGNRRVLEEVSFAVAPGETKVSACTNRKTGRSRLPGKKSPIDPIVTSLAFAARWRWSSRVRPYSIH
jgi:hypothetical protein